MRTDDPRLEGVMTEKVWRVRSGVIGSGCAWRQGKEASSESEDERECAEGMRGVRMNREKAWIWARDQFIKVD